MKKRPLSIVIIALFYLVQPAGNLLVAAYANHRPLMGPGGILSHLIWSDWLILSLFPVVAFGIYRVRKWGWYLFVAFSLLLIGYNLYVHLYVNPNYSTKMVVGFIFGLTVVVALFFRKHVYSPYFNPRMRWWEVAERYRVTLQLQVSASGQGPHTCHTLDISQSGCFVAYDQPLPEGERVWLKFPFGQREINLLGKIVRRVENEGKIVGYGIMFETMTAETMWYLHQLVKSLKRQGLHDRHGESGMCRLPECIEATKPSWSTAWLLKLKAIFS